MIDNRAITQSFIDGNDIHRVFVTRYIDDTQYIDETYVTIELWNRKTIELFFVSDYWLVNQISKTLLDNGFVLDEENSFYAIDGNLKTETLSCDEEIYIRG